MKLFKKKEKEPIDRDLKTYLNEVIELRAKELAKESETTEEKRGRGRPKGSKNKQKQTEKEMAKELGILMDEEERLWQDTPKKEQKDEQQKKRLWKKEKEKQKNEEKEEETKNEEDNWQNYDPGRQEKEKAYKETKEGIRIYEDKKKWFGLLGKKIAFKQLEDHTLLLIRTNGTIENMGVQVPDSIYKVKRPDEKEIPRGIILGSSKLLTLPYADGGVKVWIAHELETYPYPRDDIQDNSLFKRIIEKLAMNYKELERDNTMEIVTKYILPACLVIALIIAVSYMIQQGKIPGLNKII